MYRTKDGVIDITVAKNISDVIFQPADWSIFNIPVEVDRARGLSNNLYNMPSHRHVSMILNRTRRKDRIKAMTSLSAFDNKNWNFLDNISLSYGKPSTCSNNGFLPLCEPAFLFYKGTTPDTKATGWSSDEYLNATNEWSLIPQSEEEQFFKQTYYQKFSWDMQILMMTLCGRREYSRFIYGVSHQSINSSELKSLYLFCKKFRLTAEVVIQNDSEAEELISLLNNVGVL